MALKLCTLFGTRPEIIRLSRVLALADEHFDHVTVHSGQNYDKQLSDVFFDEMGIRAPDFCLNMGEGAGLGEKLGLLFSGFERILEDVGPDALLVLGDTNTALGAYMAKRSHIPVFHMEAGNRCFDENVPEETNRKIVDHFSDYNLVYTEHARRHLIAEGFKHQHIFVTGSPMQEVLTHYREHIDASGILGALDVQPQSYILASFHREENIDVDAHLHGILDGLVKLNEEADMPVLISTHPRTAQKIDTHTHYKNLNFLEPFGFFDYCKLQSEASCVLSDSGTLAEESAILDFPGVTPRYAIERPESLDCGTVIKTPPVAADIFDSVQTAVALHRQGHFTNVYAQDYQISNTAARVISVIQSMARAHRHAKSLHISSP